MSQKLHSNFGINYSQLVWALMQENLTVACEQQQCRPASTSAQSDQCLYFSLSGKSSQTCSMQHFNIRTTHVVFVDEQANLHLTWSEIPKTVFLASRPVWKLALFQITLRHCCTLFVSIKLCSTIFLFNKVRNINVKVQM